MKMRYLKAFTVLIYMLFVSEARAQSEKMDITAANQLLARTINIGYTFDAPREGAWGNTLVPEDFERIRKAGFTAIRLPVQWVARMDTMSPYIINPVFLSRINEVVRLALHNHLAIIIENCLDAQLMAEPEKYRARFLSLWTQLSVGCASYPPQVMFEVMAEPHGALDHVWEAYFTDALALIRKNNPSRPVIIGPGFYNTPYSLSVLHLPESDHFLIVTFHLYKPINFTMQGEAWFPIGKPMEWIGTKWSGTSEEQLQITENMDIVSAWAAKYGRPVFMGEFGAGNHADLESRSRFLTFYRQQAEKRHFSWAVWSYTTGFALFDKVSGQWHKELLEALIPE